MATVSASRPRRIAEEAPLLQVRDLKVEFATDHGRFLAVNGVSFDLSRNETLAIVGESGSGKSVTALALMRLVPEPPGRYVGGEVRLRSGAGFVDVLGLSGRALRRVRGADIAMISQEPMTALNPVQTVGQQLIEAIVLQQDMPRREALELAREMLEVVGIPEAARRLKAYPHEMSGGMRQRVMIAMALSCRPRILIADEPTTALDVTTQAQILELIGSLQRAFGMAVIFISHDLGVVSEIADRVLVMYAGKVVEVASTDDLLNRPRHPYTRGLLQARPSLTTARKDRLTAIPGTVPDPAALPGGCAFHPRCASALEGTCDRVEPEDDEPGDGRRVRCLRWRQI